MGGGGHERGRGTQATARRDGDGQRLADGAGAGGRGGNGRLTLIIERLTAPAAVPEDRVATRDLAGAVARIERAVRILYEVEKQRVEDGAGTETWEVLVRRAGVRVDAEEALG